MGLQRSATLPFSNHQSKLGEAHCCKGITFSPYLRVAAMSKAKIIGDRAKRTLPLDAATVAWAGDCPSVSNEVEEVEDDIGDCIDGREISPEVRVASVFKGVVKQQTIMSPTTKNIWPTTNHECDNTEQCSVSSPHQAFCPLGMMIIAQEFNATPTQNTNINLAT